MEREEEIKVNGSDSNDKVNSNDKDDNNNNKDDNCNVGKAGEGVKLKHSRRKVNNTLILRNTKKGKVAK